MPGSGEEAAGPGHQPCDSGAGAAPPGARAQRREKLIAKTERAVQKRLTAEINHWDRQARIYRQQAEEGKPNARLNADKAQRRADELDRRRQERMAQLALEKQIAADPPVVIGGALIVPIGLILGERTPRRTHRHAHHRTGGDAGREAGGDRAGQPAARRERG